MFHCFLSGFAYVMKMIHGVDISVTTKKLRPKQQSYDKY